MGTSHSFEWSRVYPADPQTAWTTITDDTFYAEIAPNLSAAEVLGEPEVGTKRHCTDPDGAKWTETCTLWEPGDRFGYKVHTETYPPSLQALIEEFDGTWSMAPEGDGTKVTIRVDAELTELGVETLVEHDGATPIFEAILQGWERRLGAPMDVAGS